MRDVGYWMRDTRCGIRDAEWPVIRVFVVQMTPKWLARYSCTFDGSYNFAMKSKQHQQMISSLVKEGRLARGYTQKELSELSNISVRSIQRIENGEIIPRNYTKKTLAGILGFSFEDLQKDEPVKKSFAISRDQKRIFSAGISVVILLLSWAFIAQSPRFPETEFEFILFSAFVLLLITIFLVIIWKKRS